jgi:hypothetical protein
MHCDWKTEPKVGEVLKMSKQIGSLELDRVDALSFRGCLVLVGAGLNRTTGWKNKHVLAALLVATALIVTLPLAATAATYHAPYGNYSVSMDPLVQGFNGGRVDFNDQANQLSWPQGTTGPNPMTLSRSYTLQFTPDPGWAFSALNEVSIYGYGYAGQSTIYASASYDIDGGPLELLAHFQNTLWWQNVSGGVTGGQNFLPVSPNSLFSRRRWLRSRTPRIGRET